MKDRQGRYICKHEARAEAAEQSLAEAVEAVEKHRVESDARALGPGRDRDDIDNDLYTTLTRLKGEA